MRKPSFQLGIVALSLVLIVAFAMNIGQAANKFAPSEGFLAPNFTLPDLKNKKTNLSSTVAHNKVTLLNFWATWCPPCRAEIPDLVKFNKKYSARGVTILAINLRDVPKEVKRFASGAKMEFPVLTDTTGRIGDLYQIYAIPTTFILDRKGKIRWIIKGSTSLGVLTEKVELLLKEK